MTYIKEFAAKGKSKLEAKIMETPKVFISYSWSSPGHCDRIRTHAERLVNDGVDTILDQWDLSEGQDKYAFMEKMVTDKSVTHVVIFSDRKYKEKADERKSGVGTESQIISREVYDKVDQKKFIPVVCEFDEKGEPFLPVFMQSRIWIDFSSLEAVNSNWERLLRALYGKPIHRKPTIGSIPEFLKDGTLKPSLPSIGKLNLLRQALLESKPAIPLYRKEFLDVAFQFADSLRVRGKPEEEHIDEKILKDLDTLQPIRDQFIEWISLESTLNDDPILEKILIDFLERLLILRYRPQELDSFNECWFEAQKLFVYEMFLYTVAILIKNERFESLNKIFTHRYILPETETHRGLVSFNEFYTHSEGLKYRNERLKLRRLSVIADVVKQRASNSQINFAEVMQAELLILLIILINGPSYRWYPHTLFYAGRNPRFPLFFRAEQVSWLKNILVITGIETQEKLIKEVENGFESHGVKRWEYFSFDADVDFEEILRLSSWGKYK